MSKFKDIEQLSPSDIESFFEADDEITYDFVEAASRNRLPKAFVSRHTYLAAVSKTRLVMWAKRHSIAKTLADISCSIDLEELSIDDTWNKRKKKGCELYFPDGQKVLIESLDTSNVFIDTLTEAIAAIHGSARTSYEDLKAQRDEEDVFSEAGMSHVDAKAIENAQAKKVSPPASASSSGSKTPVVTRDVIIESLKRANEGTISATAIKQWAMKVRDCKILDADEAMVSYILFSLSRIDESDSEASSAAIAEFYERLTVTLV
jgi:hypothetical protein